MPVIPAIGAGLTALGGGSAAVGAGLVAAGAGTAATLVGSSNAAKAAQQAGQLSYQASQDAIASQERMYEQTRADNEWARQLGMGAGSALASGLGIATPTMTGGTGTSGATTGGYDVAAYLQANPDVAAARSSIEASGNIGAGKQWSSFEDWVLREQIPNAIRNGEQRSYPTVQAQQTSTGQAAGYVDPTAMGGYTTPERQAVAPLDISASAFQESPGYQFALEQGNKALGNIASANRGLMSGQRMKAASNYNVGIANQEYSNWRDYTTNQFNNDRNFNEAIYQSDRSRLDSRYDQRNNTLLQLAGFGSAANSSNQSAAQSFANNSANLSMTGAQAQGNAAVNAANAWNQGLGNLMTTGAYLGGQLWGSKGATSTPPFNPGYVNGYNPSWIAT